MAIKSQVPAFSAVLAVGDNVLLEPAANTRRAVGSFVLKNTDALSATVTLYESPDLTSASGIAFAFYNLEIAGTDGDSVEVTEFDSQGFESGQNIIAVPGTADVVNARITTTNYSAGDV